MLPLLLKAALVASLAFTTIGVLLSRAVQPPNIEGLQIIFHGNTERGAESFVTNPDGSDTQRLSLENEVIKAIDCSQNGHYAAVISSTSDGLIHTLRVVQSDGTLVQRFDVSHIGEVRRLSVSNDGFQVALVSRDPSILQSHLYLFSQTYWRGQMVFTGDKMRSLAFSRDDKRLTFNVGEHRAVIMVTMTLGDGSFAFSPMFEDIITLSQPSPLGNIIKVVDTNAITISSLLDPSTLRTLRLHTQTFFPDPVWSPDGQGLLMLTEYGTSLPFYSLRGRLLRNTIPQLHNISVSVLDACFLTARPQSLIAAS